MIKKILIWVIAPLLIIQLIKIDIVEVKQVDKELEIKAPQKVLAILEKSCYDCHSYKTKMPWYGDIAPLSWEVRGHIKDARKWLNFQEWENYNEDKKQQIYKGIYKTVGKSMPIPMYLTMHKDAELSKDEESILKEWVKSYN